MSSKLQMLFKNTNNSNVTISIEEPKDNITSEEVKTAMEDMIQKNVFESKTGKISSIASAKIVTTEITELEVQ